jgi:hypothetical protein
MSSFSLLDRSASPDVLTALRHTPHIADGSYTEGRSGNKSNNNSLECRAGVCRSIRKVKTLYLFLFIPSHLFIFSYICIAPASTIIHMHVPRAQSRCSWPQGSGAHPAIYRSLIINLIS